MEEEGGMAVALTGVALERLKLHIPPPLLSGTTKVALTGVALERLKHGTNHYNFTPLYGCINRGRA